MSVPQPRQLEVLSPRECYALAQTKPFGRVVFTEEGLPAVHPVNFRLHGDDIVFRVAGGGKLATAVANAIVAFQVDDIDETHHTGWTVTFVGRSSLITDVDELVDVAGTWLRPWVSPPREHFVRVTPGKITGRRMLLPNGDEHAADPAADTA